MAAQKAAVLKDGWQNIGGTTISLAQQTQDIPVDSNEKIRAIRLLVTQNPILLDSFDVHFAEGQKQTVNFGGYDPVKLDGNGQRTVTKITIRYKAIDEGDNRAHVEVLGQRAAKKTEKFVNKKNVMASVE